MKHKFNLLYAATAFCVLLFTACETVTPNETKTCVVGPTNLSGRVTNVFDDAGSYTINWAAVPNATKYIITTINESDNNTFVDTDTVSSGSSFTPAPKTYTCDSFLFRVKPVLSNGVLCIPQGQSARLSRTRGGITVVIIERTGGGSCSTSTTLKQFNDNGFVVGQTPMGSAFRDSVHTLLGIENAFNTKILNNADKAGYLKIIVKNCAGVVTNTHTEFVTRAQTQGALPQLSAAIVAAAGRTGIPNPATNTNAFIENIRFVK
jgi:hypothetical protein